MIRINLILLNVLHCCSIPYLFSLTPQSTKKNVKIFFLMEVLHILTGITSGDAYDDTVGGGVNTLCLPHNPDAAPHDFPTGTDGKSYIFGSEYQFKYQNIAQDDDIPCAVCHVITATSLLMIPAKSTCPTGWNMQYNGYLVTNAHLSRHRTYDYVCLHNDAEHLTEGPRQHNMYGRMLYPVQVACGSLPCPPYNFGQYITCVVCTI